MHSVAEDNSKAAAAFVSGFMASRMDYYVDDTRSTLSVDPASCLGKWSVTGPDNNEKIHQADLTKAVIIAPRNREASPPVAARWSKVNDNGRMRRMVAVPLYGTTLSRIRPAPTIDRK